MPSREGRNGIEGASDDGQLFEGGVDVLHVGQIRQAATGHVEKAPTRLDGQNARASASETSRRLAGTAPDL